MPESSERVVLRRASAGDAEASAAIDPASFGPTYECDLVHTEAAVRGWIAGHLGAELETWVTHEVAAVLGYTALAPTMVVPLDVRPRRGNEERQPDVRYACQPAPELRP